MTSRPLQIHSPPCRLPIVLLAILFSIVVSSSWASATPYDSAFEKLRSKYLSLRNTDIELRRAKEWNDLGQRLVDFAKRHQKSPRAADALFHAALVHEELYKKNGSRADAESYSALMDRVIDEYPAHPLADDALVRQGDFHLDQLGDPLSARRFYREAIERFPKADSRDDAERKLEALERAARGLVQDDRSGDPEVEGAASRVIVLDPGHGGEDRGAVGANGILEKDVALDVAFELERLLEEIPKTAVHLTRTEDTFVPLAERTRIANSLHADLFLSLHLNASPNKRGSGIETYYLDVSGDSAAKKLAERENASVRFEGPEGDLQYILSDLMQNAKVEESIALGNLLHRSLHSLMSANWRNVRDLGVKRAPFYVLVGAHMPCVLIELSFIDHHQEGLKLAKPEYRKDLARGIFEGIREYWHHSERMLTARHWS